MSLVTRCTMCGQANDEVRKLDDGTAICFNCEELLNFDDIIQCGHPFSKNGKCLSCGEIKP